MNIPDKAVENAVEAFNEAHMDGYGEDPTDAIRDALTAAAPFIAAQALRDAARESEEDDRTSAWQVVRDMRRSADKLEARA